MSELPRPTVKALDRIATTGSLGRRPTFAHPDCLCGANYLAACVACRAGVDEPCTPTEGDVIVHGPGALGPWLHWSRRDPDNGRVWRGPRYLGDHRRCPVHPR